MEARVDHHTTKKTKSNGETFAEFSRRADRALGSTVPGLMVEIWSGRKDTGRVVRAMVVNKCPERGADEAVEVLYAQAPSVALEGFDGSGYLPAAAPFVALSTADQDAYTALREMKNGAKFECAFGVARQAGLTTHGLFKVDVLDRFGMSVRRVTVSGRLPVKPL